MSDPPSDVLCEDCGAEMTVEESWSTREPPIPILGKEIEYVEFICPDCSSHALFKRDDAGDEWREESTRPFA